VERVRARKLDEMRGEREKLREKIFSGVNLEKKRIVLEEKNNFIQQVLREVRGQAGQFRQLPGYDDFLRRAVAEGALVVGAQELEVVYAFPDEKLVFSGGFAAALESLCRSVLKRTSSFKYTKGDFDEPGVIVSSPDGRIEFDNRFSRRLARMESGLYDRLLKEF
jgi:vacuolar-type H+-ATPase subunit E/Vma4